MFLSEARCEIGMRPYIQKNVKQTMEAPSMQTAWSSLVGMSPSWSLRLKAEVERLLRKVFLALIAAMLPVTLSPAPQMAAVTLVLIASLAAHLYFWPYQADAWNRAEVRLLLVSLTLTGLTTCLIANDLHWAKSTLTQHALVFVICSIAGDTWLLQPKSQAIPPSRLPEALHEGQHGSLTEAQRICIVMLVAFLLAYMEERREKDKAEKAEET
ncbi:unnamed protein product [Symbiodinium sp. CCMP2592]|nr:unnamed protein product [Symbiodinium sp. CCMP2592]